MATKFFQPYVIDTVRMYIASNFQPDRKIFEYNKQFLKLYTRTRTRDSYGEYYLQL